MVRVFAVSQHLLAVPERQWHLAELRSPFRILSSHSVSVSCQFPLSFLLATFKVFSKSLSMAERKAEGRKRRGDSKNTDPKKGRPEGWHVGVREEGGGRTGEGKRCLGREAGRLPGPTWREHHVTLRKSAGPRPDGRTENVYFCLTNI